MATGKSIMEFLNGIGEFIDGVRENNDYEEEYYELKAIREDGKAVSEKVEDEDDTEEQTENKKMMGVQKLKKTLLMKLKKKEILEKVLKEKVAF